MPYSFEFLATSFLHYLHPAFYLLSAGCRLYTLSPLLRFSFNAASITTQSIARTELLDKPDDELFFDARSIQTAQSTESLQNVDHSETSPPYLSLPRTQGLHASITSLSSLQNTEESSCSESSVDDIANNVQPFTNLTLPEVPSNELCSPVHAIEHEEPAVRSTEPSCQITRKRRTSVKPSPKIALNLWSVLKNAIGKDITKIPLPVNFNEPISFLQRASEDLTYSYLLDRASQTHDPAEQMALVAAFSVSCYATTAIRTGKPFNPLLGETFEFDRSDDEYGWRLITEQVSHHPPGSALHCESVRYGWKIWVEFVLVSKFRGKYMSVFPKGTVNLSLPDGSRYTWIKACTVVHNLIVGTLWIDNYGDVLIQNHTNNYQCPIRFIAHSYFSKGPPKQVTGTVKTPSGTAVRIIQGSWDSYIESVQVSADGSPTGDPILLWRVQPLPAGSEDMYHFSLFTMELNEPEDGVAPTDSRLRPDQRYMEDGDWDKANEEKRRLEQKQRAKRHRWEQRQAEGIYPSEPLFTPVWFGPATDPVTKETSHVYLNNYWQAKSHQDWVACPDIF
ncbi:unnamed protein product [Dicrocoelium dendriticum]|nr:unnamed protein product [Dicrocoelium dendriticum]